MNEAIVSTSIGKVKGVLKDNVYKFMGIPYAEPPIGELRFEYPVPKKAMNDVYDATYERPSAVQSTVKYESAIGNCDFEISEDCLTLKVTTPALDQKLPVIVWLHGGANITGGGNWSWYDGENLTRAGNVVVVGVNFRLGVLGFLYHPALGTRNLMMHDAICALRWIKKNIAAFGGDPDNITVMGQSAGGNAIVYLTQMEETKGLYNRIILQSASFSRACFTTEHAQKIADKIISLAGIDNSSPEKIKEGLKNIELEKLTTAADAYYNYATPDEMSMLFRPVDDVVWDPDAQYKAAAKCAVERGLDILMGTTLHEWYAFSSDLENPEVQKRLDKRRDELFRVQGLAFARQTAAQGLNVYVYEFCYHPEGNCFKACHCIDLPFIFGTFDAWPDALMLVGGDRADMDKLSKTLMEDWTTFAKTGAPTRDGSWTKFDEQLLAKFYDNKENKMQKLTLPE